MQPFILVLGVLLALQAPADSPEDRLLKAELLEVSTGDLEKAMAVYQDLMADEKAPAAVRSRARLCLARCQRKRGELEAARKNLEEVARDPADREVARQAAGFLKELKEGRAQNADFDWIKEMEKSPEIQARVFELVMDLVDPVTDKGQRARRQLQAMGTLAMPVVERVLETSRDPIHRLNLALIAMRAGRYERIAVILDPAQRIDTNWNAIYQEFGGFLDTIQYLSSDERKRLLEIISKLPANSMTEPWAAAIRLASGDFSDLPKKLQGLEKLGLLDQARLFQILESDPPSAEAMAGRILDSTLWIGSRARYLEALLMKSPASVGKEHFQVLEELARSGNNPNPSIRGFIPALETRKEFDLLGRLASIEPTAKHLLNYFDDRYRIEKAPTEWAPVLRKIGGPASGMLHRLAEVNDGAIPEFAAFLARRKDEAPSYQGYGMRADKQWTPSALYAEAMAGLLVVKDPVALAIALEALALAPKGIGPEVLPALEGLIVNPPELHVREFALCALLDRLSSRPETGPQVARILAADFAKSSSASINALSSLSELGRIRHTHAPAAGMRKGYDESILRWVLEAIPPGTLTSLIPHALALEASESKQALLLWIYRHLPQPEGDKAILASLATLKGLEERRSLIDLASAREGIDLTRNPLGIEFLRTNALDPEMAEHLATILRLAGDKAKGWFDWRALLERDDPLLNSSDILNSAFGQWLLGLPEDERLRLYDKIRASHQPILRAWFIGQYPADRPEYPAVIEQALGDQNETVRATAVQAVLSAGGTLKPGVLLRLLSIPEGKSREDVFKAIEDLASPESIEPLVKLLDDPDAKVRQMALKTLGSIRTQLEEKKQWQDILKLRKPQEKSP